MSTENLLGGSPTPGALPTSSFSADDGWHTVTHDVMPTGKPVRTSTGFGADSKTIYLVVSGYLWLDMCAAGQPSCHPRTPPRCMQRAVQQHRSTPAPAYPRTT